MDRKSSIEAGLAEVRSFIGVKWRHRGRSRFGIDCIGILVRYAEAGGKQMRDRIDYGREPWKDGLEAEMVDQFGAPVADMSEGDVVLMRREEGREPAHVGIIGRDGNGLTLIHSHSTISVTEHGIDDHWMRLIHSVYRPFP